MARKKKTEDVMENPTAPPPALVVEYLPIGQMDAHPENRDVRNTECESIAESIRARGVREPVTVRVHPVMPGRWEIVSGHRRVTGARMAGLAAVPAMVREMDDLEALEMVLVSNLERRELDPGEEARAVAALAKAGLSLDDLAGRIHRSREWVQLRLALGELPMPMREAVAARSVSLETAAEVLRVDEPDRERAVQMVLSPTFQSSPLNAAQAREVLEKEFVAPARIRKGWADGAAKRLAGWKKRFAPVGKECGEPVQLVDLDVYDARMPGGNLVCALLDIPEDQSMVQEVQIAHAAVRNQLPILLVPLARVPWLAHGLEGEDWGLGDTPESIPLVDWDAVQAAEWARESADRWVGRADGDVDGEDDDDDDGNGGGDGSGGPVEVDGTEDDDGDRGAAVERRNAFVEALNVELLEACRLGEDGPFKGVLRPFGDAVATEAWADIYATPFRLGDCFALEVAGLEWPEWDYNDRERREARCREVAKLLVAWGEDRCLLPGWPLAMEWVWDKLSVGLHEVSVAEPRRVSVERAQEMMKVVEACDMSEVNTPALPMLCKLLEVSLKAERDGEEEGQDYKYEDRE